jgi:hypothetical protein
MPPISGFSDQILLVPPARGRDQLSLSHFARSRNADVRILLADEDCEG